MICLLTACGGGGDHGPPSPDTGLTGAGGFDADRRAPAPPIADAVEGGTVTVLGSARRDGIQFGTMDPTDAYNADPQSILSSLVTRSLTQYVYDPNRRTMVLVPDLATDLGRPNADYTQWKYTIRSGVKFEDGTPVTADAVAYGIKRSFDRQTFKGGAAYSNEFFLHNEDGTKYHGVYTSGSQYSGIEVAGNTLTLKMDRPFPDMPYWGAFPAMGPIPEHGSNPDTMVCIHSRPGRTSSLVTSPWSRPLWSATTSGIRPPTRDATPTRTATSSTSPRLPRRSMRPSWATPVGAGPR
jgi:peptide/nickel transport system substrate-binding protein